MCPTNSNYSASTDSIKRIVFNALGKEYVVVVTCHKRDTVTGRNRLGNTFPVPTETGLSRRLGNTVPLEYSVD